MTGWPHLRSSKIVAFPKWNNYRTSGPGPENFFCCLITAKWRKLITAKWRWIIGLSNDDQLGMLGSQLSSTNSKTIACQSTCQSTIAEWCGRKPAFKALIERYCLALSIRNFSYRNISRCLRTGFDKSDQWDDLDRQLAWWKERVTQAESPLDKGSVEKRDDFIKYRTYQTTYVQLAICALREKVKSGEYNPEQLRKKELSVTHKLRKCFDISFEKARPDLKEWHGKSRYAEKETCLKLRVGNIVDKYLAEEQDVDSLQVLAHAAAAQSLGNPSDSILVGLGPSARARCILQFLLLPSPGIVLNLPLTA